MNLNCELFTEILVSLCQTWIFSLFFCGCKFCFLFPVATQISFPYPCENHIETVQLIYFLKPKHSFQLNLVAHWPAHPVPRVGSMINNSCGIYVPCFSYVFPFQIPQVVFKNKSDYPLWSQEGTIYTWSWLLALSTLVTLVGLKDQWGNQAGILAALVNSLGHFRSRGAVAGCSSFTGLLWFYLPYQEKQYSILLEITQKAPTEAK